MTYHITGSISVDPTGISTTPVDLTAGMVQSWQISVLDSTNTPLYSLSSPTDILDLGPGSYVAPEITTTEIFLPKFSSDGQSLFNLGVPTPPPGTDDFRDVFWQSVLQFGGTSYDALTEVRREDGDSGVGGRSSVNSNYVVATAESTTTATPEPASLVIWSLVAGVFGVWRIRKRRRVSVAA